VLSSIVASVGFLEAMINELYQDAHDGYVHEGYLGPLSPECLHLMAEYWRTTEGRTGVLDKHEMLLAFAGAPAFDHSGQSYEHARLVIRLRNTIVHYQPENVSAAAEAHTFERSLRGKFADNALMAGSGNPWWTDHALGFGCAEWSHRAVTRLSDDVCDSLGLVPSYKRFESGGWSGQAPGARE
jgi:hypothetical protein